MGAHSGTDRFERTQVVVLGDAVVDRWMHGRAGRLCREAPVPVVDVASEEASAGGAANAAVNVAALGGDVVFVSRVGDDAAGEELRAALRQRGVDDRRVMTDPGYATPVKHRLVADGQIVARYDRGRRQSPPPEVERRLVHAVREVAAGANAILVCDYGYRTVSPALVGALSALRRRGDVPLVVDAHDLAGWAPVSPTVALPSFDEAVRLVAAPGEAVATRPAFVDEHAAQLLDQTGAAIVAVTLDAEGAVLLRRGHPSRRAYARPAPWNQTTGAGDTFTAAFTLSLASGERPEAALETAQAAAAVVVRRAGTAVCTRHELLRELAGGEGPVVSAERLARRIDEERLRGRRIVFTNGCFDVLHRGHVSYLQQARSLGDVLVVALNSDASVGRLKGPERPVNPVEDRAAVLAGLGCVDFVSVFDEDTPQRLLELVRPDVYVKGGDYTPQMLPETPVVERLGGQVRILDYVEDHSTTALIERIRDARDARGTRGPRGDRGDRGDR